MNNLENEIVTIKLSTQEEVVCKFLGFGEDNVMIVDKPMVLSATHQGFTFIPLVITASKEFNTEININVDHVITFPVLTEREIKSNYLESTTGLKLV